MKNIFLLCCLACLCFNANAEVQVPDDLKFIFADDHFMNASEKLAWDARLHDTPNIADRLCDLLWACYKDPVGSPGNGIGSVMGALMQRDDISPPQLKKITDEMRRLAKAGLVEARKIGAENMLYGVRILERYPTPEHEDLALILLKSDDQLLSSNAATTLGRIGTARSVEPMRKHFDPFRHIKTEPPNDGHQVFEAEQMLLARVAGKSTPLAREQDALPSKQANSQASSKPLNAGEVDPSSTPLALVIVMISAALGLLWLMLKQRTK